MSRAFGVVGLLLVAVLLGGCAAGAPTTGAGPEPTATAQPIAAVQPTLAPAATATPVPPTVPPEPSPTPTAPATEPAGAAFAGAGAPAIIQPAAEPTLRPAPPPDPGTGLSVIVPDPATLESPLLGAPEPKEVALTFDAGADTGYAAAILDLLAAEGIKATFGMTGQWAEANPELVERMVAEGHQLINHTWDHGSLTGANTGLPPMSAEEVAWQLGDTEAIVKELTGYDMKPYFRPPYGDHDETSLRYLYDNGYYLTIWWTCDTHGWAGWDAGKIAGYCTTNIKPHEIILLHVGAGAAGDYESLPAMIDFFRQQGYAFVTVEQMLQP